MKKIVFVVFLLALGVAAGRAQESRQDVSLSGDVLIEPFISSQTNVMVSASPAYGALASYRYMLTPSSALEANYGVTYHNSITYTQSQRYVLPVNTRTQELSAAYVRSFTYRKFNPFLEAGPGAFVFLPILNSATKTHDVKQQITVGAIYGAGVAYEISPSFDIRAEYRGMITKVPNFGNKDFSTNKWYNIFTPTIGVAYHF